VARGRVNASDVVAIIGCGIELPGGSYDRH
jgi:hypothetical protein